MFLFIYILNKQVHGEKEKERRERDEGNVTQRIFRHFKMDLYFPAARNQDSVLRTCFLMQLCRVDLTRTRSWFF